MESPLRRLSDFKRDPKVVDSERKAADVHYRFCIEVAEWRHRLGKGFVFEQGKFCGTWDKPYVRKLSQTDGVFFVTPDLCRFGLRIHGTRGPSNEFGLLSKKPTGILTNIAEIAEQLDKKCKGDHKHGLLLSGTAAEAAKYTPLFIKAILKGLRENLQKQGILPCVQHSYFCQDFNPDVARAGFNLGAWISQMCMHFLKREGRINVLFEKHEQLLAQGLGPKDPQLDSALGIYAMPTIDEESILEEEMWDDIPKAASKRLTVPQKIVKQPEGWAKLEEKAKSAQGIGPFEIPPEIRREVMRVHVNLFHAPKLELLRALKHAGVKPSILRWVKDHFTCPTCEAAPQPNPARPALIPRVLTFNKIVGIDCVLV